MTAEALSLETRQYPWWLLLLGGILNIIVGLLLLANPVRTVIVLVWVLGFYWLIQGILMLVGMFLDHSAWGWKLFMGILSILAGLLVMRHPVASSITLPMIAVLLLGIQGIIVGVVSVVLAFKGGGWGAGILGAISIIFGLILVLNFASPGIVVTFILVAAIFAIVGGFVQIFQAIRQRNE